MNWYRFLASIFLSIALSVGAMTLIAQYALSTPTQIIDVNNLYSNGGHSFQIPSTLEPRWRHAFEIQSDDNAYPRQSNLVILEDGVPLGPPHSVHIDIKEQGNGRYSHWETPTGSIVIFSTSDNSDPRINGRRYELSARPVPFPLFASCVLLFPLFFIALQRLIFPHLDFTRKLIAIITVATLLAWANLFFERALVAPDSTTYIRWSHLVPLGYPLFLSAINGTFGSLGLTAMLQIGFLVFASTFLAYSVRSVIPGYAIAPLVLILLLCYIPMFWYAGWLLSEALFVPLILVNLGAAFRTIVQPSIRYALLLSTTATLILFVRPAGYYVVAGIMFLLVAKPRLSRWGFKWIGLPFVIGAATIFLINAGIRGTSAQSQVGRVLFPTVAFLFEPRLVTGPYKEYVPIIQSTLRPYRDEYETKTFNRATRVAYLTDNYNYRLLAMDQALDAECRLNSRPCPFELKERIYLSFFVSTVLGRPLDYAKLVMEQSIEAWITGILVAQDPFRARYLLEAANAPIRWEQVQKQKLPLTADENLLPLHFVDSVPGQFIEAFDRGYGLVREQRWLVYLTGLVTLAAIPIAALLRRNSRYWLSLGYCGIMIHGSIVLTTAVTVFIPRYAVPVDPVILVACTIIIAWPISRGLSHVKRLWPAISRRSFSRAHRSNQRSVSDNVLAFYSSN